MTPGAAQGWKGLSFKLGSIPVLIRPMFFVLTIVFGLRGGGPPEQGAVWLGIVFFSILTHELGHALAMRSFGFSPTIELHGLGGFTSWSREKVPTAGQRLIVTLCGPGAGLVLGLVVMVVIGRVPYDIPPLLQWTLLQARWVNIGWSVLNLMPVLPWDGGMVVDSAVELMAGKPKPKVAAVISLVFGAAIVVAGVYRGDFLLVYFGGMGLWRGYARFSPSKDTAVTTNFWALIQAQRFIEAERLALEAIVATPEGAERWALYELVAWARLLREDWPGVEAALQQMKTVLPSRHLTATLAAHSGRFDEVLVLLTPLPVTAPEIALRAQAQIALGRPEAVVTDVEELLRRPQDADQRRGVQLSFTRLFDGGALEPALRVCLAAFEKLHDPIYAFNAACALTRLGRSDEAIAALNRAIDAGYQDGRGLLEDPDLAPLRSLSAWGPLVSRLPTPAKSA